MCYETRGLCMPVLLSYTGQKYGTTKRGRLRLNYVDYVEKLTRNED